MHTIYDFITIAIFAGLIVLFLQRSMDEAQPGDALWQYLVAAVGLAITNYCGNHKLVPLAIVALIGTVGFILWVLRPFPQFPRR
jgi:hypothetical protein